MMSGQSSSLPKRPRLDLPAGFGAIATAMRMGGLGDDGSDDEDGHSRKGSIANNRLTAEAKRSQHCEVEKRRREKMNKYMSELAQMIPACNAVPRKLDKLSVLRMAVDHMKNLRGDPHSDSDYKPGFLTDDELKQLVVEAANGFMVIISCERGRVLFVSDTIDDVLSESPDKWLGSCFYDILHPKDIAKVKEQLACFDVEEALAASVKQNCNKSPLVAHPQNINGLRRSFLCRVKKTEGDTAPSRVGEGGAEVVPDSTTGQNLYSLSAQKEGGGMAGANFNESESVLKLIQSSQEALPHQYAVLHCTGYIRNLTPAERLSLQVKEEVGPCLVVVARLQHFGDSTPRKAASAPENEFVSRIGTDGRFTYVDPRISGILGYLPQDLIGQVSYEYFHPEDIQKMVQLHNDAMKQRGPMPTVHYRFLSKTQKWIALAMKSFSFVNPFSHQVEYVVCTNIALTVSSAGESQLSDTRNLSSIVLGSLDQDTAGPAQPQPIPQHRYQPPQQPAHQHQQRHPEPSLPSELMNILPNFETDMRHPGAIPAMPPQQLPGHSGMPTLPGSLPGSISHGRPTQTTAVVSSSPANTTVSENRITAQRIVDEYNRMTAPPPHRVDMNYEFPAGLFTTEVNLEGSAEAYQTLLGGLEGTSDLQQFLNQVDADPFKQNTLFGDLDFDVFD